MRLERRCAEGAPPATALPLFVDERFMALDKGGIIHKLALTRSFSLEIMGCEESQALGLDVRTCGTSRSRFPSSSCERHRAVGGVSYGAYMNIERVSTTFFEICRMLSFRMSFLRTRHLYAPPWRYCGWEFSRRPLVAAAMQFNKPLDSDGARRRLIM